MSNDTFPRMYGLNPIPIYVNRVEFPNQEHALEKLRSEEYFRYASGSGFGTKDNFLLNKDKFSDLRHLLETELEKYVYDIICVDKSLKVQIENSWGVRNDVGDYAKDHWHMNSLISCVFYVAVDDKSGDLEFSYGVKDSNLFPGLFGYPYSQHNMFNSRHLTIKPQVGMVVIFPSHVYHKVMVNESNITRFSIAFNASLRGQLGSPNSYDYSVYNL